MSITFGQDSSGGWAGIYNDAADPQLLGGLDPLMPDISNVNAMTLSYWYSSRPFPVGQGGTMFCMRSDAFHGYATILKVWHGQYAFGGQASLNITVGDSLGAEFTVQAPNIVTANGVLHNVQIGVDISSGLSSLDYASKIHVTHDIAPVAMNYVSGILTAGSAINWKGTVTSLGKDIHPASPLQEYPQEGTEDEVWFSPFKSMVDPRPAPDGTPSGYVTAIGPTGTGYLAKRLDVDGGFFIVAGLPGYDGYGPFPPGSTMFYPNKGKGGVGYLPPNGCPPIFLHGRSYQTLMLNRASPFAYMFFGAHGQMGSTQFLKHGGLNGPGVLGSGDRVIYG